MASFKCLERDKGIFDKFRENSIIILQKIVDRSVNY